MGLFSGITKVLKAVSPVSGLVGAGLGYLGQREANQTNVDLAEASNATSIDLANTSYQRRVADLKAAGLNPMLAYMQGGAQVPNITTARVENSAASASQSGLNAASQDLIRAQTDTAESQAALNSAQAAKAVVEARAIGAQAGMSEFDLSRKVWERDNEYWSRDLQNKIYDSMQNANRTTLSDHDMEVLAELDKLARKYGYKTFNAAEHDQDYRSAALHVISQSYQLSKQSAESDFYKTDFGKSVAPFISSAQGLTSIAGGVTGLLRPKRGIVINQGRK